MVSERERSRCRERLERLGESSLDLDSLRTEALAELRRVIRFDRWCWPLADPETLIPLSGVAEHDYGPGLARLLELEYSGGDYAAMGAVARLPRAAASLWVETRGDLARSPRWDQVLRPVGIGDEAVLACRDALGCWGWIKLYRDSDEAGFGEPDLELLARVGPLLGCALRTRLEGAVPDDGGGFAPRPPGVIVLDRNLQMINWTAGAREWVGALPLAGMFAALGMLPAAVYPVAALARGGGHGAHALERAVDGRWVRIEAAPFEGESTIAVALRGATPAETFDFRCRAYALTRREREVVAALVAGLDTRAVTERLFISAHTVQDHLKSVFAKAGVRSRRELLTRFRD